MNPCTPLLITARHAVFAFASIAIAVCRKLCRSLGRCLFHSSIAAASVLPWALCWSAQLLLLGGQALPCRVSLTGLFSAQREERKSRERRGERQHDSGKLLCRECWRSS